MPPRLARRVYTAISARVRILPDRLESSAPVHRRRMQAREGKCDNASCFPFDPDCRIQFSNASLSLSCHSLNRPTERENKHPEPSWRFEARYYIDFNCNAEWRKYLRDIMAHADSKKGTPYLFSSLIASGLAAALLFAGRLVAVQLEHTTVSSTAPELFSLKNQGLAFQRAAVQAPNVLPLYGTSELIIPSVQERANLFFRGAPTGFQVSPVGGGGANLLS